MLAVAFTIKNGVDSPRGFSWSRITYGLAARGLYSVSDIFVTRRLRRFSITKWDIICISRLGRPHAASIESEIEIVNAFFAHAKRERYVGFLNSNVSCAPGALAHYEGEAPKDRFILHRRSKR